MVLVGLLSVRQWCAALLDSACALHKSAPDADLTAKPEREKISQIFFFPACKEVVCEQEPRQVVVWLRS